MPRGQHLEAPDQQHRVKRDAERQADPDAVGAEPKRKSEHPAAGEADQPEADRRKQQRHARVVEAAQAAGRDGLHAVRDEEARAEHQQRGRERDRLGGSGASLPRKNSGSVCRVAITSSVIAAMNATPSAIATKPARRVAAASPRPTAWPTRTVAAMRDAERHHEHHGGDLQRDLMRGERRRADPAHQLRGGGEHAVFQQERARHRRADDDQLPHEMPIRAPEAPEHAVFAERTARIAHPDRRNAHADIDDRRRKPGAEQIEPRQAERAVDQRIGEQRIRRNRRERDPQSGLGPVHRAHEIAQRHEEPARHDAPRHAEEIALRKFGVLPRLPEREQQLAAPELHDRQRHAENDRRPQADAQRAAHHARLARAIEILRGERRHRRDQPHAEHEHHEQHGMRERGRRDRPVAEPADQREIARHHGDLAELRQRDRQRELDRLGHLVAPNRPARRRGGLHRSRHRHGAHHSRARARRK